MNPDIPCQGSFQFAKSDSYAFDQDIGPLQAWGETLNSGDEEDSSDETNPSLGSL